MELETCD